MEHLQVNMWHVAFEDNTPLGKVSLSRLSTKACLLPCPFLCLLQQWLWVFIIEIWFILVPTTKGETGSCLKAEICHVDNRRQVGPSVDPQIYTQERGMSGGWMPKRFSTEGFQGDVRWHPGARKGAVQVRPPWLQALLVSHLDALCECLFFIVLQP